MPENTNHAPEGGHQEQPKTSRRKKDSPTALVVRKPKSVSAFRRSVIDGDGERKKLLVFEPDVPQKLNAEEIDAVRRDIGLALVLVDPSPKDPGRFQIDWEGTEEVYNQEHGKPLPEEQGRRKNVRGKAGAE